MFKRSAARTVAARAAATGKKIKAGTLRRDYYRGDKIVSNFCAKIYRQRTVCCGLPSRAHILAVVFQR
jgi:hypothetical protein